MSSRLRGKTVAEALHPEPSEELVALAQTWCLDASERILETVWLAYDRLARSPEVQAAITLATDDLERGITQQLALAIDEELSGDEPFTVQPEVPEGETREVRGRPPAYDIAFIYRGNIRIMWPLEAKVMPPDRKLAEYLDAVKNRYVTCKYAPFLTEGAMTGYVLRGNAEQCFADIAAGLDLALEPCARWPRRNHRVSRHVRSVPAGKPYPADFRCHHLLMVFANPANARHPVSPTRS